MSNPITWQTVAAPSFKDAFSGMAIAQEGMQGAFTGLTDMLKKREATQTANWDQGKLNNTDALFGAIQEAKTPEEYAAKEAQLREQLLGYGAQVDSVATRNALDGRMATLQQRNLASMQYGNAVEEQADAPNRDLALSLYAQGNFAGGDAAAASVQRNKAALFEASRTGQRRVTTEGQADTTFNRSGEKHTADLAHQAEQERIARGTLAVSQANAENQRLAHLASTNDAGIRARTANLEATGKLVEAQTAASKEVRDNTPYAKPYNDSNMETIRKMATELNNKDPKYGNEVIKQLAELKKEFKGDLPLELVQSGLSMAKTDFWDSWKGSSSYASSVAGHVRNQMRDPEVLKQIAYAKEQTAKSKGQYESTTVEPVVQPTGNAAIGVAPSGVVAPSTPPQTKFVPPKISEKGSLVYDKPGSLNISGHKGIMVPSSMPTGSLEASVPDGDTISIKGSNNVSMKFRFNGLDTQETSKTKDGKTTPGQKYGEAARTFITDAFKQGRVDIKMSSNKPDAYGRHVADIYVDGKSLNEALIRNGHATVMTVKGGMGPAQTAEFQRLQKLAMAQNLGIMGDLNSNRTPTGAAYRMFGDTLYE